MSPSLGLAAPPLSPPREPGGSGEAGSRTSIATGWGLPRRLSSWKSDGVQRNAALALGALAGAAAALLFRRKPRSEPGAGPREHLPDQADELRRKLAEARATQAEEDDFAAAGMGAETMVTEESPPQPPPIAPGQPPPADEFEAMRRRVHEEGRAAAEEMRRRAESEESPP